MHSIDTPTSVSTSRATLGATLIAALSALSIAGTAFGLGPMTPAGGVHFPPVQVADPPQWLLPQEVHNTRYPQTLFLGGPGCEDPTQLQPFDSEIGDLATARLTPYSWPFHVEEVQYVLIQDMVTDDCRAGIAHDVLLFVSDGDNPGDPPELVETIHVPAVVVEPYAPLLVTLELDESIELDDDESLFVAVQMNGTPGTGRMCIMACGDDFDEGTNTWSPDGSAPGGEYDWVPLEDYDIYRDYAVGMRGMAPFAGFIFGG